MDIVVTYLFKDVMKAEHIKKNIINIKYSSNVQIMIYDNNLFLII